MAYIIKRLLPRPPVIGMACLLFSAILSGVAAAETGMPVDQENNEPTTPLPAGRNAPTDFEIMELHYRRYAAAANSLAQLASPLNQKIQEVALAAKRVEAKNSAHNRRQLEEKLRQLESTRSSFINQHAQLQSQMNNEDRSYTAMSKKVKGQCDGGGERRRFSGKGERADGRSHIKTGNR